MWQIFSAQSKYSKKAKFGACLWTLLILLACFIPGNEVPNVHIPMVDKWVHFILFGVFCFMWLLAYPQKGIGFICFIALVGCIFGWLVEELQGLLSFLGRAKDWKDIYADALGAILGALLYYICKVISVKQRT